MLPDGEVIQGPAAIGAALGPFFEMNPEMDLRTERVLRTGGTALVYSAWTATGTGADGSPVVMTGNSTLVTREQPDGTWKIVIDDPGWNG